MEDAAAAGADAAILVPPFYFPLPDEMLYGFFEDVGSCGRAPGRRLQQPAVHGQHPLRPSLIASLMELDERRSGSSSPTTTSGSSSRRCGSRTAAAARSARASTASSTPRCASARAGIFSTAAAIVPAQMVRLYDLAQAGDHAGARGAAPAAAAAQPLPRVRPGLRVADEGGARDDGHLAAARCAGRCPDFPESERPALRDALARSAPSRRVPA